MKSFQISYAVVGDPDLLVHEGSLSLQRIGSVDDLIMLLNAFAEFFKFCFNDRLKDGLTPAIREPGAED